MTNIILSDEEARSFILFRQHQNVFEHLVKANVFNVLGGKATLSFDFEGTLTSIDINFQAYKRQKIAL